MGRNGQSPALSQRSGRRWYGENGRVSVGAVFIAMETSEKKTDLTVGFPDIENGGGEVRGAVAIACGQLGGQESRRWGWSADARRPGHGEAWRISYSCSPTQKMGDTRFSGGWGSCRARESSTLAFGGAGGGERGSGCTGMVMGAIVAPSSRPSKPKRAWSSPSSFIVGVSIFVLPSSSISPVLQRAPSALSCSSIPPLDTPRAPHQSIASSPSPRRRRRGHLAFRTPFRAEMAADIEFPRVLHTLVVCGCRGWWRLAPMSMLEVLGALG